MKKYGFVQNQAALLDKFQGCLLGLALGDALCADREGGLLERLLWKVLGRTRKGLRRYTDDTQMTLDLAAHLVQEGCIRQDVLAAEFARSYRWSRGYGPGTAVVLKQIKSGTDWRTAATARYSSGSFGNGAAMRIAPVALLYHAQQEERTAAVVQASVLTHPNPAAVGGAQLIAEAIVYGLHETEPVATAHALAASVPAEYAKKMQLVVELLATGKLPEPIELRQRLGTGSAAVNSCPAAVLLGLHFSNQPFAEFIAYVRRCSGDTDTVGAMAGAIWGAYHGSSNIPEQLIFSVEGSQLLLNLANLLHGRTLSSGSGKISYPFIFP